MWRPEGDEERMKRSDSEKKKTKDKNGHERIAQKEEVSPKTTLEGDPGISQKELDKAFKEELHTFKKDIGKNEDPEHEAKVSDLLLESADNQGDGEDEEPQANGNHCEGKDEDPRQGEQGRNEGEQGQSEDEDPRRARLSGLSLTLGRGAVPRALRCLIRNVKIIFIFIFIFIALRFFY